MKKHHYLLMLLALVSLGASADIESGTTYVLQNVKTGYYLGGCNSWGTQACVIPSPQQFTFTTGTSEGTFVLTSYQYNSANHSLSTGLYVDNSAADWAFEEGTDDNAGTYTIYNESVGYISVDTELASDANVLSCQAVTEVDEYSYWKVISIADVKASQESANALSAVDVTPLINNPTLNYASNSTDVYWSITGYDGTDEPSNFTMGSSSHGSANVPFAVESYHSTTGFNISQSLYGLAEGVYEFSAQGFYRIDGGSTGCPVIYAGDKETTLRSMYDYINDIYDGATPGALKGAGDRFIAGMYPNSVQFTANGTDGVKIGIKGEATDMWNAFSCLGLKYYGSANQLYYAATEISSGDEVEADTWYAINVPYTGTYTLKTGTDDVTVTYDLTPTDLTTDNTIGTEATSITLEEPSVVYVKASAATTLRLNITDGTYTIGEATCEATYVQPGQTVTISFGVETNDLNAQLVATSGTFGEESVDLTAAEGSEGVYTFVIPDDVTADTEYTLTLAEGALTWQVDGETKGSSTEQTLTFRTPALFDQTGVYMLNAYAQEFMSRGYSYATEADLDPYGIPMNITINSKGEAVLSFCDSNGYMYLNDYAYTDGTIDNAVHYTISSYSEDDVSGYQFKDVSNDDYLYWQRSDGVLHNDGTTFFDDAVSVWQILTREERDAFKEKWLLNQYTEVAASAGVTVSSMDDFNNYVSQLSETEVTDQVENASFMTSATDDDGNPVPSAWTTTYIDHNGTTTINASGNGAEGMEMWNRNATVTQTISGLDAGIYKLTIQGFHRMGTKETCASLSDYDLSIAYVQAGDYQINLKPWASGADLSSYDPNNMEAASTACNNGKYENTLYTYVDEEGTLTITIGIPGYEFDVWTFVKNLTLTKLSSEVVELTLNEDPSDAGTYYGTFSSESAVTCGDIEGLKAYYLASEAEATDEDNAILVFNEIEDGVIPAETGALFIYSGDANQETVTLDLPITTEETSIEGNLLQSCLNGKTATEEDNIYVLNYVSTNESGIGVGFYHLNGTLAAGKAYVELNNSSNVKFGKMVFGSTETGIGSVAPASASGDAIYDLTGRKITKPQKGSIYISQGKKVLY